MIIICLLRSTAEGREKHIFYVTRNTWILAVASASLLERKNLQVTTLTKGPS